MCAKTSFVTVTILSPMCCWMTVASKSLFIHVKLPKTFTWRMWHFYTISAADRWHCDYLIWQIVQRCIIICDCSTLNNVCQGTCCYCTYLPVDIGAIQVLRNAVGVGVSAFPEKSIRKVYGSTLLPLLGGGGGLIYRKKSLRNTDLNGRILGVCQHQRFLVGIQDGGGGCVCVSINAFWIAQHRSHQ